MCIRDRSGYQQQAPSGRMRKYYRLTRKGRELLAEKKAEWALSLIHILVR